MELKVAFETLRNGGIDYDSFDGFHLGFQDFTISFSAQNHFGDGIYLECLQKKAIFCHFALYI